MLLMIDQLARYITYLFVFLVESLPFLQYLLDFQLKQTNKPMTGYHHFSSPLIRLQKITTRNTGIHHKALPIHFRSKTNTPIFDKRCGASQYSNIHGSKSNSGSLNYIRETRLRNHNSKYNNGNLAQTRNKITAGMPTQRTFLATENPNI